MRSDSRTGPTLPIESGAGGVPTDSKSDVSRRNFPWTDLWVIELSRLIIDVDEDVSMRVRARDVWDVATLLPAFTLA